METDLRFPIGRFKFPESVSVDQRTAWIADIEQLPERLREALEGVAPDQHDHPYRPGGWTIRQVVHHLADSHLNAFVRFKLTLTEDQPAIKPYHQDGWAQTPDSLSVSPQVSLGLLEALHLRWTVLLRAMTPDQFSRTYLHPEQGRALTLDQTLALYAWHGRHHVAHILGYMERSSL